MIDINTLSKEELRELNKRVIERLNALTTAELLDQTSAFNVSDIVSFDNNGRKCYGVVLRVNQKTISVAVSPRERWKVSPSFLKIVKKPSKKALNLRFLFFPQKDPQGILEDLDFLALSPKQTSGLKWK